MLYLDFYKELNTAEKYIIIGLILTFLLGGFGDVIPVLGLIVMTIGGVKIIREKGYKEVLNTPLTRPFLLFIFIALFSLIKITSIRSAFNMFGTLLEIVFGFFISFYIFKNKSVEFHRKMLNILFAGGVITALYGIYESFFINPRRLESVIGNSNLLGVYMLFLFFLSLSVILQKSYKTKVTGVILFLLFGYNLLFSLSISAFLGSITGLLFFFIITNKKILIVVMLLIILSPLILPDSLVNRFETTYQSVKEGNDARIYAWQMFKENPVIGVGIGHFREHYVHPPAPDEERYYNHSHNIFLQIMSELGMSGLLSFIFLIFLMVKVFYDAYPFSSDFKGNLCLVFSSAFTGFFVQSQSEFSLISSAIAVLVGILLGWYIALLKT